MKVTTMHKTFSPINLLIFLAVFSLGFLSPNSANAQQISIQFLSFPGITHTNGSGYFYGGGGLSLAYQKNIGSNQKYKILLGLEYRMIDWGNQAVLNIGYNHPYLMAAGSKKNLRLSGNVSTQFGAALFREKPLFVWSAEYIPEIEWFSRKRFFASLGVGLRYTNCPKYKNYGNINSVLEIPIKLSLGFKTGKSK